MAAEKALLYVLFEEFLEPDEIVKNMCLILQNTLDVTQGRIIHRRDWASALGHQPIGGHQVIKIMTIL